MTGYIVFKTSLAANLKSTKKLCKIFKQSGMSVTVECKLQIKDFFDATIDLRTDKYPYTKNNNQLLYFTIKTPTSYHQNNNTIDSQHQNI